MVKLEIVPAVLSTWTFARADPVIVVLVNATTPDRFVTRTPASAESFPLFVNEQLVSDRPFTPLPRMALSWLLVTFMNDRLTPAAFESAMLSLEVLFSVPP